MFQFGQQNNPCAHSPGLQVSRQHFPDGVGVGGGGVGLGTGDPPCFAKTIHTVLEVSRWLSHFVKDAHWPLRVL